MKNQKNVSGQNQQHDIQKIEEEILDIDAGILNLLDRRMKLATAVWKMQQKTGQKPKFFDLEKEKDRLFEKLEARNKKLKKRLIDGEEEKLLLIWGKIIELSNKIRERTD